MKEIIIALGSNHDQQLNIAAAQRKLKSVIIGIRFSRALWTEPIGIDSDKFLNCLGFAQTTLHEGEIVSLLKSTEQACGNTTELRKSGRIVIDIDLLLYGEKQLRQSDWQREYIKTLLCERSEQYKATI